MLLAACSAPVARQPAPIQRISTDWRNLNPVTCYHDPNNRRNLQKNGSSVLNVFRTVSVYTTAADEQNLEPLPKIGAVKGGEPAKKSLEALCQRRVGHGRKARGFGLFIHMIGVELFALLQAAPYWSGSQPSPVWHFSPSGAGSGLEPLSRFPVRFGAHIFEALPLVWLKLIVK